MLGEGISLESPSTTEVLILMFVKQLQENTVHLPLMLGYSMCSDSKIVDKIINQKYGLSDEYTKDLKGLVYDETPLWVKPKKNDDFIFKSHIATLADLFIYIHYNKKNDGIVDLPNGKKCNIPELFDYISISYLITHYMLTNNNIYPSDMHSQNIFIHWFDDNSYYQNKKIKNIDEIIYKVHNKFYKIKTFGFVIVLGDLGNSIIKIKKDIILIGNIWDIKNNYKLIETATRPTHYIMDFFSANIKLMTFDEIIHTVAFKILSDKPYSSYPINNHYLTQNIQYLEKQKTVPELLKYYDKTYGVPKYHKKDNNILIIVIPH